MTPSIADPPPVEERQSSGAGGASALLEHPLKVLRRGWKGSADNDQKVGIDNHPSPSRVPVFVRPPKKPRVTLNGRRGCRSAFSNKGPPKNYGLFDAQSGEYVEPRSRPDSSIRTKGWFAPAAEGTAASVGFVLITHRQADGSGRKRSGEESRRRDASCGGGGEWAAGRRMDF